MSQVVLTQEVENNNSKSSGVISPNGNAIEPPFEKSRLSPVVTHGLILAVEFAIVTFAAFIAKFVYINLYLGSHEDWTKYLIPAFAGAFLVTYFFSKRKLYDQPRLTDIRGAIPIILSSVGLAFLLLIALAFAIKYTNDYSRIWLGAWAASATCALLLTRCIIAFIYRRAVRDGIFSKRIAILGSGEMAQQLRNYIEEADIGATLVGVFDDPHPAVRSNCNDIDGTTNQLIILGQQNQIDEVIVASSGPTDAYLLNIIESLRILPIDVMLCPSEALQKLSVQDVNRFGSVTLLKVQKKPIPEWGYITKSVFDFIAALAGVILLSPLLLLIALAIKLTSKGQVFFSQKRHGYNHKVINVLKFRTMTVMENGDGVIQVKPGDKRVTFVGRFLRRSSLDELPQLFNVLAGDMSLVGPRPHALTHNHYYSEMLEHYANRHCVKPGITGLAQINGFRGPTEDLEKMRGRVEYDLKYIDNWSFWLDIKILFKTISTVISGKNAH